MFFFTHPVRGGQHRSISLQYIICSFSTTHPTAVLLNPIFAWCHCTLFLLTQGGSNQHPWQSPLLLSWQSPNPPWPYTFSQERDKDVGSVADFMQLIFILETIDHNRIMFYAVNTDYLFCQLGYKLS